MVYSIITFAESTYLFPRVLESRLANNRNIPSFGFHISSFVYANYFTKANISAALFKDL